METLLCNCGCGNKIIIKPWHKYYGIPKYIRNHYLPNRKNMTHTEEAKLKMRSSKLGKKRKPFSALTRLKLRNSHLGKVFSLEHKQHLRDTHIGKTASEETKKKMSLLKLGNKYMLGKRLSEKTKQKIREARLRQIFPIKDTSIEVKVHDALTAYNIAFEKHKPILGQPDIFIKPNICIFTDGDYWHGSTRPNQQIKDVHVTTELKKQGYIVLRFWEHEINTDLHTCISKIIRTKEYMYANAD